MKTGQKEALTALPQLGLPQYLKRLAGGASGREPTCQCRKYKVMRVRSLGLEDHPGENGNPLHYSCLENPWDRRPWWAIVLRVPKSRTQLKRLNMHSMQYLTCMYLCVCVWGGGCPNPAMFDTRLGVGWGASLLAVTFPSFRQPGETLVIYWRTALKSGSNLKLKTEWAELDPEKPTLQKCPSAVTQVDLPGLGSRSSPDPSPQKHGLPPSLGRPTRSLFLRAPPKSRRPQELSSSYSLQPRVPWPPREEEKPGHIRPLGFPQAGASLSPSQLRSGGEARLFHRASSAAARRFGLVWGGDWERLDVVRRAGTRAHL